MDVSLYIAKEENLSPKALLYDCTNYFTYIDTLNDRNTEAQRGCNKQGRHNLRQLGLAVAVTPDFHIPLFHAPYPGNPNDITLVFDKGNTSEEILYSLQDSNISCIAAAPLFRYPEMSTIDLKKFQKTDDANLPAETKKKSSAINGLLFCSTLQVLLQNKFNPLLPLRPKPLSN